MTGSIPAPPLADLLFRLLRWDGPRAEANELAALGPERWRALAELAAERAVAPLLRQRLLEANLFTLVPLETRSLLEVWYQATALRTMGVYAEVARIARLAGPIPLAVLKGPALAAPIYGNVALRAIGDLDLLVAEDQVQIVAERLDAAGYRTIEPRVTPAALPYHLPPLARPDGACPIEIHWRLTRPDVPYAIPTAEVWERLETLHLPGCTALGLAPDDLLIYLAVHATHHHDLIGVGPRPLCDIAQLIATRGGSLNWVAITERAGRWHCARGLALALALSRHLLGAAVPHEVLAALRADQIDQPLLAAAAEQLLSSYGAGVKMPADLAAIAEGATLAERGRRIWRRLFVSPAELAAQFHAAPRGPMLAGLYVRRAWALLSRHSGTALALAWGTPELQSQAHRRRLLASWLHEEADR